MSIRFGCACGRSFTVPDELAGKHTRCPGCKVRLTVPTPAPADDDGFEVVADEPPAATARPPAAVLSFRCGCGQPLEVGTEFAGMQVECPTCEAVVTAPSAGPALAKRATRPAPPPADEPEEDAAPTAIGFARDPDDAADDDGGYEAVPPPPARTGRWSRMRTASIIAAEAARPRKPVDEKKRLAQAYLKAGRKKLKADERREQEMLAAHEEEKGGWATNGGMIGGGVAMLLAVVWLVVGLVFMDFLFFYPFILFGAGLIGFIKGQFTALTD